MLNRIQSLGFTGRTGHPCAYDALDIAARLVRARSYLEIGVYDGGSLFSVLQASTPLSRLVLCDLFAHDWIMWGRGNGGAPAGTHAHIDQILALRNYQGSVDFCVGDSKQLVPRLPKDQPFDLIFVDGDHSYEAAIVDFRNVWPLSPVGGLIVMDDSSRPELQRVCQEIESVYQMRPLFMLDDGADTTTVYEKVVVPEGL